MTIWSIINVALAAFSKRPYPSKTHTVPHTVRPRTEFLANAGQTGIKVLDQSGLNHFIRERQFQSPRHCDGVEILTECSSGWNSRQTLSVSHSLSRFRRESKKCVSVALMFKKQWIFLCLLAGHSPKHVKNTNQSGVIKESSVPVVKDNGSR